MKAALAFSGKVAPQDALKQLVQPPSGTARNMPVSMYQLKPRFQGLLRPCVQRLFTLGVTANQVTVLACAMSVLLGLGLSLAVMHAPGASRPWFALIPLWMLLRMALNAIDGMLAREHGQQSMLGAYLNELTDVLSDTALYLPFAWVAPVQPMAIGALCVMAALSEMAGLQGLTLGAGRRYEGPMGKSDRALVFGVLGLGVCITATLPAWLAWVVPVVLALTAWTTVNRVRAGLRLATTTKVGHP
jgi:CDP-diacylglycerol--glycerol-3-phosphate 3-phosphatidyltransferase